MVERIVLRRMFNFSNDTLKNLPLNNIIFPICTFPKPSWNVSHSELWPINNQPCDVVFGKDLSEVSKVTGLGNCPFVTNVICWMIKCTNGWHDARCKIISSREPFHLKANYHETGRKSSIKQDKRCLQNIDYSSQGWQTFNPWQH